MTQKIKLTALQNEKLLGLINQVIQIQNAQSELVKFIADSQGHMVDEAGRWKLNESILEVDVLPVTQIANGN